MLKTTDADSAKVPGDQPDYIEDDAETADVDESEDANEHVFTITVTDGTSENEIEHDFTLTVTDVDDPAPGSNQKLNVNEGVGAADGGTEVGSAPLGDVAGSIRQFTAN